MGAPGKEHLIPENTFIYFLQFNGKRFQVSEKYKGIAIRTVRKRVKDPIQDRPPYEKYIWRYVKKKPINKIIIIIKTSHISS